MSTETTPTTDTPQLPQHRRRGRPQNPKPPSRATRPAGTGTRPQHSQPHPPRQTSSLRRVNPSIYIDSRKTAPRQCNDTSAPAKPNARTPAPGTAAKAQPRRGTTRLHSTHTHHPQTPHNNIHKPQIRHSALRRMAYFSRLSPFFCFYETPKNGVSTSPNAVRNECKAKLQTDHRDNKKQRKNLKTHKNQTHER
jgi:hypothetical protein